MISNRGTRSLVLLVLILSQLLPVTQGQANPSLEKMQQDEQAETLLERMTPEERVGQLFLITFQGSEVTEDSAIYKLITRYHIGGVILKRKNDNFIGPENTLYATWQLNQAIQETEYQASQEEQLDPLTNEPFTPNFIPLFIGIAQGGDNAPDEQILNGLTPLPSQMAIGATWNTELAHEVGEVLGSELEVLGVNLLLGPSLDVLEDPQAERAGDLGVHSFGGNPYWVSLMGQSYISGVHSGSNHRIIVAANHFPGLSSADRPPEEEIPSVRKSLEQLMQVELVPFFSVTGEAPDADKTLDALVLAHAKYEGFQGNISPTTRPISFDPQALEELMSIPQFASWREDGGLIISDELGARAIRRFEDPGESSFNARLVALNAFLAGNDLLNLGNFISNEDPNGFTTILRTLDFFSLKYREDVVFAQRVDEAVLRILTTKFNQYPQFSLENVLSDKDRLDRLEQKTEISFEVARQAATLLSPAASNLEDVFPAAPAINEQITIITDTYLASQCSTCQEQFTLSPTALKQALIRLYGPASGSRIQQQNIITYSFADLDATLNGTATELTLISDIQNSDWVVFLILDSDQNRPTSQALVRLLSERPDLLQEKNSLVFSLNAPYYLDATAISNLTAYYGLYSKQPAFIEVVARLLFKELPSPGASPVSVKGVAYELQQVTSPNPNTSYSLRIIEGQGAEIVDLTATPEIEPPIEFFIGDPIYVQTGIILDYNNRPVPDNTEVRLTMITTTPEGDLLQRETFAETKSGIANFSLVLEIPGTLQMQTFSGSTSAASEQISIEVADPFGIAEIPIQTNTAAVVTTPEMSELPVPQNNDLSTALSQGRITAWHWILLVVVSAFVALFAYQIGATTGQVRWGMRWALTAFIGGLLANTYFSFGLPGSENFIMNYRIWGIVIATIVSTAIGWGTGWVWSGLEKNQ